MILPICHKQEDTLALKKLEEMKERVLSSTEKKRIGVVAAEDDHTLKAIAMAVRDGLVEPVLIGEEVLIEALWASVAPPGQDLPEIVEAKGREACVDTALNLVRSGNIKCLMKGRLETGELMKGVVNREKGIKTNNTLSLLGLFESPYYHKVFAVTDMGLLINPTLEQKKAALENAVQVFHILGTEYPKVGVLAAVEKVNPKMQETTEAADLKEMNRNGQIPDCIVEGPISYDLCMDPEAAVIKGYDSPVAGDADVLLVPNIVAGNLMSKALACTGGAKTCGIVWGAAVPIVLTSRSASAYDKYMSIVFAALVGGQS
jgi:phosphotransacetylase